jgi:beta-lactamase regulating signal transducer with metallopeptidase domain
MTHLNSLWNLFCIGSLRAGLLIGLVLGLRWLLRGRVPAQCFHWLWVLVSIRLLLPVAPESATSIFNLLRATSAPPLEEGSKWVVRKDPGQESIALETSQIDSNRAEPVVVATSARSIRMTNMVPLVWMGGVLLQVLLLARSALAMRQSLRRARPLADPAILSLAAECAERLGIQSRIQLLESSAIGGPAIVGLWRPRLILPAGMAERLSTDELRFVLLHEYAHVRRRDLAVMWLLTAARVVHWFNPLAWIAIRAARTDTELACDETVLRHTHAEAPVPYGETLLKLSQLTTWRQPVIPAVAITEGKRAMQLRLQHIAAFGIRSRWHTAAAIVIVLGVTLVFAADETSKAQNATGETKAESAQLLPEWAKDWSIIRVNLPADKNASEAEIEFLIGDREKKALKVGEASDTEAWVEKLEADTVGGESRWKATLRKGKERAEFIAVVASPEDAVQVEIEAKFIETNDTVIRRLRLKAPKDGGRGIIMLDDVLRGRGTTKVLTEAEGKELSTAISTAAGTQILSTPRVVTRSGQRAVIEIIRECRYPGEWDSAWDEKTKKQIWKPKAFETRNTGVTLEVEPKVEADETIALNMAPQIVEFLGFKDIDTGKAVPTEDKEKSLESGSTSRMEQVLKPMPAYGSSEYPAWRAVPIFSTRKVTVSPIVRSGEMYVCTDFPEMGKVVPFKSPSASKRLIVLVTARLVSAELKRHIATSPPVSPNLAPLLKEARDEAISRLGKEKEKAAAFVFAPAEKHANAVKSDGLQYGKPVSGKPGFVTSPFAPDRGYVDVRGFPPGTVIKCPYAGKIFLVP